MVETTKKYYRVDRREISFLKFILEAYDGLEVQTTVDSAKGIAVINIAPGCEADVELVLQDLKKNVMIEKIDSKNQLSE